MSADTPAVDIQSTLEIDKVPIALNPVAAFHKSRILDTTRNAQSAGISPTLNRLRLLTGQWAGIAHIENSLQSADEKDSLTSCLSELARVRDQLVPQSDDDEGCIYDGMGSESEFQVLPVILRYGGEVVGESLPAAAVQGLGVDPELAEKSPPVKEFADSQGFLRYLQTDVLKLPQQEGNSSRVRMMEVAQDLFDDSGLTSGSCLQMIVGNEGLPAPTLVFWLRRCTNKPFVVGLMTALVWT